jgi:SPP1 family predicted phage head-tail adaptor
MGPGKLTDRIILEKRSSSTAPNGDLISTWTVSLTTLADVRVMTGEDQVKAGKLVSENRIKLVFRYRTDVNIAAGDRLTWRERTFLVEPGIIQDKKRIWFTMTALTEFEGTVEETVIISENTLQATLQSQI